MSYQRAWSLSFQFVIATGGTTTTKTVTVTGTKHGFGLDAAGTAATSDSILPTIASAIAAQFTSGTHIISATTSRYVLSEADQHPYWEITLTCSGSPTSAYVLDTAYAATEIGVLVVESGTAALRVHICTISGSTITLRSNGLWAGMWSSGRTDAIDWRRSARKLVRRDVSPGAPAMESVVVLGTQEVVSAGYRLVDSALVDQAYMDIEEYQVQAGFPVGRTPNVYGTLEAMIDAIADDGAQTRMHTANGEYSTVRPADDATYAMDALSRRSGDDPNRWDVDLDWVVTG